MQVLGTLAYGHAEELASRRLRARLRWARLRASLAAVVSMREASRPLQPPRIAGPARLRTGFVQHAGVADAMQLLARQPPPPSGIASTAHPSTLAAAAAAVEADLEGSGMPERGGGESQETRAVTAAWVAASRPRAAVGWPAVSPSSSFEFHRLPLGPGISRSAQS